MKKLFRALSLKLFSFSAVFFGLMGTALAEEAAKAAAKGGSGAGWAVALGAAFAIGLAAFGGALAQGKTTSTALDGIARNPGARGEIFTPMIVGLVLIESLVIYALVISFVLIFTMG